MGHLKVCNLISRYLGFVQINLLLISNLDPLWSENVSCMSFITPSCSQTEIQSHILGLARCFYLLCYEKQYWGKDELGILVPILQYFLRQIRGIGPFPGDQSALHTPPRQPIQANTHCSGQLLLLAFRGPRVGSPDTPGRFGPPSLRA